MGDVGYHLAQELSREQHHITVIDRDERVLTRLDAEAEVFTVHGSSCSFKILQAARISEADLYLGVTSNEEANLTSAILAKKMGARRTLARVSNGEFAAPETPVDFGEIGVDHVIYPEELAAREIVKLVERAAATDIHDFEEGRLTLLGLKLSARAAPLLNGSLQDVMLDATRVDSIRFRIVLVKRGRETIIPTRDIVLRERDQIIVMTKKEGLGVILKLAGMEHTIFNNIMILGGGRIGRSCALMLQDRFNVKLLEADVTRAWGLADQLNHTLILHGDGRNMQLLKEEGIGDMDAFIAVTEDAETNIISSLLARQLGVKKTIAHVENSEYSQLTEAIGVDVLINKRLIAADDIARLVRRAHVVAMAHLQGMDAEVLEILVPAGSQVTKKPLRDLKFPQGAIIGGVVRGEETLIAVGDTHVMPDDRVVVFTLPGSIEAVEAFFQA